MTPRKLSNTQAHRDTVLTWYQDIIAHSYRLVRPARAIARVLGLSPHEADRIGLAALLHDVGKLAIPKAILCKPGPLTEEEWAVMHRHPELGHQMLSLAGEDWAGLGPIVAAHHEHWDGGGYPTGLANDAIPKEARMLSVVDAYDAMVSPRVYRQPLSHEEARAELQRCSGHQFDPQMVAAFLQVLDDRCGIGHMPVLLDGKHRTDGGWLGNLFGIRSLMTLATTGYAPARQPRSARTANLVGNSIPSVSKSRPSRGSIHQETDRHV